MLNRILFTISIFLFTSIVKAQITMSPINPTTCQNIQFQIQDKVGCYGNVGGVGGGSCGEWQTCDISDTGLVSWSIYNASNLNSPVYTTGLGNNYSIYYSIYSIPAGDYVIIYRHIDLLCDIQGFFTDCLPGEYPSYTAYSYCVNEYFDTLAFTVSQSLTVNLDVTQPCLAGEGKILVNTQNDPGPFTYTWLPNVSSGPLAEHLNAGTYTCIISSATSLCSDTIQVLLYTPSPMNITSTTTPVGCSGNLSGSAYLNVTGGDAPYSYMWTVPGFTGDSIVGVPAGIYYAIVSDSNGCKDSAMVTVGSGNTLSPSIIGTSPICAGDTAILTSSGASYPNYEWNTGSLDPTIIITPSSTSTYTLTVTNGNCSGTATFTVVVNQTAQADFDTIQLQTEWTFLDSSINATSWFWNFGDGSTSTEQNPTHSYDINDEYAVMLVVGNDFGCVDTIVKKYVFAWSNELIIPNVFTPNFDGYNDYFTVHALGLIDYELIIYNRWGTELFRSNASPLSWDGQTSSGSKAPQGIYYYILKAIGKEDYSQNGHFSLLR